MCSAIDIFCMEKPKPWKTDTAFFCRNCNSPNIRIFFAILFTLNIISDIFHAVIDKHVYIWRIWLSGQLDSFGNDWFQLLQQKVDILNNILINVLGAVDML